MIRWCRMGKFGIVTRAGCVLRCVVVYLSLKEYVSRGKCTARKTFSSLEEPRIVERKRE
jgi:hypothetical protein